MWHLWYVSVCQMLAETSCFRLKESFPGGRDSSLPVLCLCGEKRILKVSHGIWSQDTCGPTLWSHTTTLTSDDASNMWPTCVLNSVWTPAATAALHGSHYCSEGVYGGGVQLDAAALNEAVSEHGENMRLWATSKTFEVFPLPMFSCHSEAGGSSLRPPKSFISWI